MKISLCFLTVILLSGGSVFAQADLKPLLVFPADYLPTGTHTFDVMVQNIGSTTVQVGGHKIGWQVNDGPVTEATPTAPLYPLAANMPQAARVRGNFSVTLSIPGTYKLKVWTRTTSLQDANLVNDTIVKTVKVLPYTPIKNVLLEVFKHQACCPCLPAAHYEDTVIAPLPTYAIANIYTPATDVLLYNADGSAVNALYNLAHPAVFFDRYKFPYAYKLDRSFYTMGSDYQLEDMWEREKYYSPIEVSFTSANFNTTSRELKVKIKAKFYDTVSGDYRFNLYVTEDSVKAWQGCALPDPYDYYHMRVLRHMSGGPWGDAASLGSIQYPGDVKYYEMTYTVPANFKTSQMNLIGMVQHYDADKNNRSIANSAQMRLTNALTLGVNELSQAFADIQVYPNPVQHKLIIKSGGVTGFTSAELTDINGKLIKTVNIRQAETIVDMSCLPSGMYTLTLYGEAAKRSFEILRK
jgi:hypothetical protein